jgi:hypothetical protein
LRQAERVIWLIDDEHKRERTETQFDKMFRIRDDIYSAGYRAAPIPSLSFSLSGYYNVYPDLRSVEFSPGPAFPLVYGNKMEGISYGAELWGSYAIADWWRLSAGSNLAHEDLRFKPGSSKLLGVAAAGDDPHYQASLRSSMDLPHRLKLDLDLRDVGRLPNPAVPSYAELNARLGREVFDNVEISIAGFNLLHNRHEEFDNRGAQRGATQHQLGFSVDVLTRTLCAVTIVFVTMFSPAKRRFARLLVPVALREMR